MEILSFQSSDEADHVMKLLKSKLLPQEVVGYFIGAVTIKPGTRTSWYWVQSGKRVDFAMKFMAGDPNNGGDDEKCLSLVHVNGNCSFNDSSCTLGGAYFLCQLEPKKAE